MESSLWLQPAVYAMQRIMQLAWARGLDFDDGAREDCCSAPSARVVHQCISAGLTELQEHIEHGDKECSPADSCRSCQGPSLQSVTAMSATGCQAG